MRVVQDRFEAGGQEGRRGAARGLRNGEVRLEVETMRVANDDRPSIPKKKQGVSKPLSWLRKRVFRSLMRIGLFKDERPSMMSSN